MIIYLIIAIAMGFWSGYIARNRNRSEIGWGVAGFFFGLIAVLIVFLSHKVEKTKK